MLSQSEGTLVKVCLCFSKPNSEEFRDLYQDIVCALWESWRTYRGKSKLNTWVTSVAINTAVKYYRKRKRMPQFVEIIDNMCDNFVDEGPDTCYQHLYELIESLDSGEDRKLVYLYLDKKSIREIAKETGITEAAVKQRLYRIKKKLKQLKDTEQ